MKSNFIHHICHNVVLGCLAVLIKDSSNSQSTHNWFHSLILTLSYTSIFTILVVSYSRYICKRELLVSIYNYVKLHRQNRTRFGGAGKQICFSCWTLWLSAPVCIVHHHLDIFSVRFCVHGLPLFYPFLHLVFWKNFTQSFIPWQGIFV